MEQTAVHQGLHHRSVFLVGDDRAFADALARAISEDGKVVGRVDGRRVSDQPVGDIVGLVLIEAAPASAARFDELRRAHPTAQAFVVSAVEAPSEGDVVAVDSTQPVHQLAATIVEQAVTLPQWSRPPLSPRQLEVLQHLADGVSPKQIAVKLGITTNTCRSYIREIRDRLGCSTVLHAVMVGIQQGWLEPPGTDP